jgi:hypothetical protein
MKNYNIFVKSNNHARNINTPMMGRTYYTKITVQGKEALTAKVAELRNAGEHISEISTDLGTRIYM